MVNDVLSTRNQDYKDELSSSSESMTSAFSLKEIFLSFLSDNSGASN